MGELRPGTQFVAFPSPSAFGVRDVYVGWAWASLRGCRPPVSRFYRRNLVTLVRDSTCAVSIAEVTDLLISIVGFPATQILIRLPGVLML
jgi:hypothetical protein